ncbi:2-amino-4-hydroxy-6-hydroxymethyldihydropteridine diphosphokinase [Capnocytophaga sp. ARDL2]|uniref:2-amino-4-hydroxy-6- hydroxymethyldihydropteridine diphosphokinase n=1 Tax=Capnocytophaga sp. ARDL2 TaxID=3238809 RepID=UPI003557FFDB
MNTVFLSLGSNISPRKNYLNQALKEINQRLGEITAQSKIYETPAWGFVSENFYNMAIAVQTEKSSKEVIDGCLKIEKDLGRVRLSKNGYSARVIDIDVLFFNEEIIQTEKLIVPHPLLHQRDFVLLPLQEIAANFVHPIYNQTITQLRNQLSDKIEEIVVR